MKTKYYILAGIVYTLFIGFTASSIQQRVTSEAIKDQCFIDGCTKVYEFTGEVGGEEWEELIVIAEEYKFFSRKYQPRKLNFFL